MDWNNPIRAGSVVILMGMALWLACTSQTTSGDAGTSTPGGSGDTFAFDGEVAEGYDAVRENDGSASPDPLPLCESLDDCLADAEVCDCSGSCVSAGTLPCSEDKNCGVGSYCDTCWGYCAPVKGVCEPCVHDPECEGTGSACLDLLSGERICGLACLSDVGCPAGYGCVEVQNLLHSQCVPKSGECDALGECQEDTDCPFPQICNPDLLECAIGCPDDEACPVDTICHGGHCVASCHDVDNPCPAGQVCDEGHCKIPGGCVDSADCEEKETYCDLTTSLCVGGCQVDADCKESAKACVEGTCQEKGCTGNFFCAFGQVCNLVSGQCEEAEGPYCSPCDSSNDVVCAAASPENVCLGFQGEEGEDLGDFCLVACGEDAANPCPQGYACEEVDLDGTSHFLCARNCSVPPVGI